jgi:hypothetical protein
MASVESFNPFSGNEKKRDLSGFSQPDDLCDLFILRILQDEYFADTGWRWLEGLDEAV